MNRKIVETKIFAKKIEHFVKKGTLLIEDVEAFKKAIMDDPYLGDLIPASGGIRKARLKSASRGKSGGFRVWYYFVVHKEHIHLLSVYPKNEQEDLTLKEKAVFRALVIAIKEAK